MKFLRRSPRRQDAANREAHARRVRDSGLFDADWYRATYPEIADFAPGPLAHFCEYGVYEHRDPGPNFDTRRYLDACPAAGTGAVPPFLQALSDGEPAQGRPAWLSDAPETLAYLLRTSGLFDEAWYRDAYPDVARSGKDALGHYLDYGAAELRDPGPAFDAEHYANAYPHVRETFASPIAHYLRLGLRRGYRPTGLSRYGRWLAVHDELTGRDLERIAAAPVPGIVRTILVPDSGSVAAIDGLLGALADQAGASWLVRLLRGPGLEASSWRGVAARVAGAARIACVAAPADAMEGLTDGDVVLLGAGTVRLRPHALHAFAAALAQGPAEAAYCDHDRIDGDGVRHAPVFKPAMSPLFMRHTPYAGPVIALRIGPRTRDALALALTRLDAPERAWADLLLALDPARVIRVPLVLYHLPSEVPVPPSRTNQPVPGPHRPRAPIADVPPPTVRIVIPTRDRSAVLKACIDSILAETDYPPDRYGIAIVDNGSVEDETARYLAGAVSDPRVAVVASPGAFNFSKICNDGAAGADAEILVFLNNDMTVREAGWLRTLASYARRPDIGAVGAQLLYPDETVQHGGVALGVDGVAAHALVELPVNAARSVDATREMSAVTGACLAIRRSVFAELGGFDPLLRIDFNDVDLCCAALAAGYRNLYVAEALLHHHESLSRGSDATRAGRGRNHREAIRVRQRHAALIRDDPSYNPNLSLDRIGALAVPPRVVPPWRRPAGGVRRVLLLSDVEEAGSGVARMVAEQAAYLAERGFEVVVGSPERAREVALAGCRHVALYDARAAATFATREGVDAIVAHAAPFFAVTRHLGRRPLVYLVDHGEPPPGLFPDREAREDEILEKRLCASLARRVFATSTAARDALFTQDAVLLTDGRVPAATWSDAWAERRPALRERFGFSNRFVVLDLCRVGAAERPYNGFDDYVALAGEYLFTDPGLGGLALFVAADRAPITDQAGIAPADLLLRGRLSDRDLADLFAASDLYLTTQRWQGPGCGIAGALAMGLPVVASDIAAHRAYPIDTAPDVPGLCRLVSRHAERWRSGTVPRSAVRLPGSDPLMVLADTITRDLSRDENSMF